MSQVKNSWYETEDKAQDAWTSIKDWIFDSWTESQLKAFCDHHNIPGKKSWQFQPLNTSYLQRQFPNLASVTRSSRRCARATIPWLRRLARQLLILETGCTRHGLVSCSVIATADKPVLTSTESDLKEWLDTHGIPAPQPSTVGLLSSLV